MAKIEELRDAIKADKEGVLVFDREDGDSVHYFVLTLGGKGIRTEIPKEKVENASDVDSLLGELSYSEVDKDGVEFFKLEKEAYKLEQSQVITLKKYINRVLD